LALRDWLKAHRVTQVAMEASGLYWKPVWAILEDEFDCLLVNARHVKQVPGRKTDVFDAARLCQTSPPPATSPLGRPMPGNDRSASKRRSGNGTAPSGSTPP
jgi:transposase